MSFAFAAVDKVMVVVEVDPKTLFIPAVDGKVIVLLPVASCVTTKVPYAPAAGVDEKLKVLFPPKVTLAFNPFKGSQTMVAASVNACGVDA